MGWDETHRYYVALREVEAQLDRRRDGVLPWAARHERVFGSPAQLRAALVLRWTRLVQAQVTDEQDAAALAAAHPGLYAFVHPAAEPEAAAGRRTAWRCGLVARARAAA